MNDIEALFLLMLMLAAAASIAWTAHKRRRQEVRGFEVRRPTGTDPMTVADDPRPTEAVEAN